MRRTTNELLQLLLSEYKRMNHTPYDLSKHKDCNYYHGMCFVMEKMCNPNKLISLDEYSFLRDYVFSQQPTAKDKYKFWTDRFWFYWNSAYYRKHVNSDSPPDYYFWWKPSIEGYKQRIKFIECLIFKTTSLY